MPLEYNLPWEDFICWMTIVKRTVLQEWPITDWLMESEGNHATRPQSVSRGQSHRLDGSTHRKSPRAKNEGRRLNIHADRYVFLCQKIEIVILIALIIVIWLKNNIIENYQSMRTTQSVNKPCSCRLLTDWWDRRSQPTLFVRSVTSLLNLLSVTVITAL